MKRFYQTVATREDTGGHAVLLDGRPVRTPARQPLLLPTGPLADAIAAEWEAQQGDIRPRDMALTGLANAAIDRVAPDVAAFAAPLAGYAGSDMLCYRATDPADLVAAERTAWDPLLEWARARLDLGFAVTAGVGHARQSTKMLARVGAMLAALDPWALVALDPLIRVSGSAVIGLAVLHGRLDGDAAFAVGHVDELWQASRWGDDAEAAAARADRRQAMLAAARFLDLAAA